MEAGKLISKLSPKSVAGNLDAAPVGGLPPELDPATIAGALAGLPDPAYWLARAKYLADERHSRLLWDHVERLVVDAARRDGWHDDVAGRSRPVALLLLTPAVWGVHCNACSGRGRLTSRRGVVRDCSTCEGSGRGTLSDRERARMIDVPATTFRRVWRHRLADLSCVVADWEILADVHVVEQLRRG